MNVIIYGNGWIGNILHDFLKKEGFNVIISEKRLGVEPLFILEKEIANADVVINTAAKTNIDWCEKNKVEAHKNNVKAAVELAKICKSLNKKYVFFSSACVFESPKDVRFEDDEPNPGCFYAYTKVIAEKLIQEILPETLIIRPRLPISEVPHPRNTINKIMSYRKLHDNQESVTVIEDMLPVLKQLIEENQSGIFHLVNAGTISPIGIAEQFEGNWFEVFTKEEEQKSMLAEGRAKRVTTLVGSKRIPLLPHIRTRMPQIAKKYQQLKGLSETKTTQHE